MGIQDFSRRGGSGWYLGVAETMAHASKMWQIDNWNLNENCYTGNTTNATK